MVGYEKLASNSCKTPWWVVGFFLLPLMFLVVACNPDDTVNSYFAKLGLNRLALARNDIEPGALILVGGQGAIYADNMFDYLETEPENEYGIWAGDKVSEYKALLRRYQGERD